MALYETHGRVLENTAWRRHRFTPWAMTMPLEREVWVHTVEELLRAGVICRPIVARGGTSGAGPG